MQVHLNGNNANARASHGSKAYTATMFETTKHARVVLTARGIKAEWIDQAVWNPVATCPDREDAELEHRFAIISSFGNRVLRVVVKLDTSPPVVVTAYFDRTMKGKL